MEPGQNTEDESMDTPEETVVSEDSDVSVEEEGK